MRQCLACVLPPTHLHFERARIVAHQPDVGFLRRRGRGAYLGHPAGYRHRGAGRSAIRAHHQSFDLARISPDARDPAVHHDLRRVDSVPAHSPCISPLPIGELAFSECVLPSEPIPIGHREAEGENIRPFTQRVHVGVGWRAGGAALALKKLYDRGMGSVGRPNARAAHRDRADKKS